MSSKKYRKGDKVIVVAGRDKGKVSEILKVYPREGKLLLSGVNVATKHAKRTKDKEGGITKVELPIAISNVAILDPKLSKATKVGFKFLEDGKKVRYAKLSGEIIDNAG